MILTLHETKNRSKTFWRNPTITSYNSDDQLYPQPDGDHPQASTSKNSEKKRGEQQQRTFVWKRKDIKYTLDISTSTFNVGYAPESIPSSKDLA